MYSNIVLADANGVLWKVSILDSGILQNVPATSGTGQTILLSAPNGVTYQIGIAISPNGGSLVGNQITSSALATQSFTMLSATKMWNFSILNGGILQQTQQTWASSAGTGGPALHQPPTGPNPNLAITENAGLFGGLEFTYWDSSIYFTIFNPGRSA